MIESIAAIGAITVATPSVGRSTERRQKRLKWLSSLRAASGLSDEKPDEFVALVQTRAQIADALEAEAMRDGVDAGRERAGPTITAARLARLMAAAAEQSVAVQAHLGAAAVRRFVETGR